jgi:hypothetical protein
LVLGIYSYIRNSPSNLIIFPTKALLYMKPKLKLLISQEQFIVQNKLVHGLRHRFHYALHNLFGKCVRFGEYLMKYNETYFLFLLRVAHAVSIALEKSDCSLNEHQVK